MKCLILGGSGFLGSHLAQRLTEGGDEVHILDRHPPRIIGPGTARARWIEGDFRDVDGLGSALRECEVIYHLVSTTLPKTSNDQPVFDIQTNVAGTVQMLQSALRAHVRRVVFVSSGGTVYGIPHQLPIAESHLNLPLCSYGIGKLMIEKYLHLFRSLYGLQYCVLRLANPYGEWQAVEGAQGAVAAFLYRALKRQPIDIWGDGSVVRDYLYVGDAVGALVKAKACNAEWPVFNIGSGIGRDLNELIAAIENLVGHAVERRYLPKRGFDVPSNVLDISKAGQSLDWRPEISFEEGLRRTLTWMTETSR